jgi:exodeoxyribonuclease VII small subunit
MPDNKKVNFESALKNLDEIVKKLESDDLSLEESIKSFESGISLVKKCQKELQEAELKINKLLDDGSLEKL